MNQKNIITKIISNPVAQTFLVYISGGWIVLEMTDYFINNYNLNERFRDVLLIILLIGLPVALVATWYITRVKEQRETGTGAEAKPTGFMKLLFRKPWFSIPGAIVVILLVFTAIKSIYQHDQRISHRSYASAFNIQNISDRSLAQISLAVLPFTNYTGKSDQDWLVEGQHETLINELSKLSQLTPLRVISRSTVNAFKNYDKSIPDLAREINVDFLVEASVLDVSDSISMQLRLIRVYPEETVVWAQSCSSDFSNILKLHGDLASQIAHEMDLALPAEKLEKLLVPRQVDPESYKAYLRGMFHLNQLTPEGIEKGLDYLHEAVSIDPAEPFAYAGLALGYLEIAHGPLATSDDLAKAEAAALQAIKLDSSLAEIHSALGEVYLYKLWQFDKAEYHLLKALELNPNLAITHYHYSWALYLWGHMEEAIKEHKLAQKYDPFNPLHTAWLGALYCYDGQYDLAVETALESFEILEDYPVGYYVLGITYLEMGRYEEAIEAHKKLADLVPLWKWQLGYTFSRIGQPDETEKILEEYERTDVIPFTALGRTILNASVGRFDDAFKWLNYEPHHAWTAWAAVMPEFSELRKDSRFKSFEKRLNLPD